MSQQIVDERGARFTLGARLGSGGQGEVFQLTQGRLAVKLVRRDPRADSTILRRRLERVKRLDLDGLPIARPLTVLRPPNIGYVMELLPETLSFSSLICPPAGVPSLAHWYQQTGGLRGRLRVLTTLAGVLGMLHSRGIAYSDLSPDNVRIAGNVADEFSLHLIDSDNLRVDSSPDPSWTFTPGYAAPELVAGRSGANTLSDLHAFAVLAFETLTGVHPFVGDVVERGEPEMEELAFAGSLPWVDDPVDRSNATTRGVPRDRVLSPLTRELFSRAFGPGRTDPGARPRFSEWAEVFAQAADVVLHCSNASCGGTYFLDKASAGCPWCGTALPAHLTLACLLWDPAQDASDRFGRLVLAPGKAQPRVVGSMRLTEGVPAQLEKRHLGTVGLAHAEARAVYATLAYKRESAGGHVCEVTNRGDQALRFARRGSPSDRNTPEQTVLPTKRIKILLPTSTLEGGPTQSESRAYLHFGAPNQLHRVFRFGARA